MEYYISQICWSGVYFQGSNMPSLYFPILGQQPPKCYLYFHGLGLFWVFFNAGFFPACKYDLAGWWELSAAFPTGNSLGQQCGIHAGLYPRIASSLCTLTVSSIHTLPPSVEHSMGNTWVLWKQTSFWPVQVFYLHQRSRDVVARTGPRAPGDFIRLCKCSQPPISHATREKTLR